MRKIYATTNPAVSRREIDNKSRSRRIAAEGMVLLENSGVLPMKLEGRRVALFGEGARHTVRGGTGSGEVNTRENCTVEQGLEAAGAVVVTKAWLDRFDEIGRQALHTYIEEVKKEYADNPWGGTWKLQDFRYPGAIPVVEDEFVPSDDGIAVYVLSRNSGEGKERRNAPGDYQVSEEEQAFLKALTRHYAHVVVVLNVGSVMDIACLRTMPGIDAILLMSQAGSAGGEALADVLSGKVTPCGHLTTTWAERYEDYPNADRFSYLGGDASDEYYSEGIFVGYRWFDATGKNPAYPFGYGKSYTDFSMKTIESAVKEGEVSLTVRVTNVGARYAGRQVVQVYVSAPEGKLDKPCQELRAYAKTGKLLPGESEDLAISFGACSMASFDEERAAWVLEPGSYTVRVGEHSRATSVACLLTLTEEIVVEQLRKEFPPDCEMEHFCPDRSLYYTYPDEEAEKAAAPVHAIEYAGAGGSILPGTAAVKALSEKALDARRASGAVTANGAAVSGANEDRVLTMEDVLAGDCTAEELAEQLTVEEMATLCVGTARGGMAQESVIGAASTVCPGAAGETTSIMQKTRKIHNIVLADGPAGLRLARTFKADGQMNVVEEETAFNVEVGDVFGIGRAKKEVPQDAVTYYQYCTAIPIATMLAQTWDADAIWEAGDIVGSEMEELGVTLWLAPGMNIHRNPLCGRNFEYYSEDPLVSGICAAMDTAGVQSHPGVGTTIKHFACNNLETNRMHSNSHVGERALREIYLKGFEIAVKAAQPLSIMTSYNLLNGVHTPNSRPLVTNVARGEWGFAGVVMTDWDTTGKPKANEEGRMPKYGSSGAAACIKAGNDLIMPGSQADVDEIIASVGAEEGAVPCPITLEELRSCAANILRTIALSNTANN